ncbi:MAG: hypothetical protein PUF97_01970 [Bifidobacteriaceae bacterium]|nr:hypothetical protein [Bifidobacteriaceae bacterium]
MLGSELRRWMSSPLVWGIMAISALLSFLSVYGCVQPMMGSGRSAAEQLELSRLVSTMPFGGALFSSILGILVVTQDIQTGYFRYLVLRHNGFWYVAFIKMTLAVALAIPTVVLNLVAVHVGAMSLMTTGEMTYTQPQPINRWIATYSLMYVVAACWGVAVGFCLRNSMLAIAVQFVYQTIAEAQVISSFPKIGRWLFGGAESAIVNDFSLAERFDIGQGVLLSLAWIAILFAVAFASSRRLRGDWIFNSAVIGHSSHKWRA